MFSVILLKRISEQFQSNHCFVVSEDSTFSAYSHTRKLTPIAKRTISPTDTARTTTTSLSAKVLVLNQSYEPISVCTVRKAILMIFLSKAELVELRSGVVVHSTSYTYPFPSVIRLQSYIRVPYKKVELSRKNILRRDGFRCQYCGSHIHPLTIDHIIPRSRGGGDTWENLVAACIPCNNRKGNHTPEEAGVRLLSIPRRPNHIVFLKHYMGKVEEPWRPYLFVD